MKKVTKILSVLLVLGILTVLCAAPAFAADAGGGSGGAGNVASVVEQTWKDAAGQIKTVMNSVVFPALSMVLAIAFFCKLGMAFFDYRKHGQFEFTGPIILFACLIFVLTAPLYIWTIVGI